MDMAVRWATVLALLIGVTLGTGVVVAEAQGAACEALVHFVNPRDPDVPANVGGASRFGVGILTSAGMVVIPSNENGVVSVLLPDGQPTSFSMVPMYMVMNMGRHSVDYPLNEMLSCGFQTVLTYRGA